MESKNPKSLTKSDQLKRIYSRNLKSAVSNNNSKDRKQFSNSKSKDKPKPLLYEKMIKNLLEKKTFQMSPQKITSNPKSSIAGKLSSKIKNTLSERLKVIKTSKMTKKFSHFSNIVIMAHLQISLYITRLFPKLRIRAESVKKLKT